MKKIWLWAGVIFAFLFALVAYLADVPGWTKLDMEKITHAEAASVMLDQNGNEAALLPSARARIVLKSNEIPETVKRAFVAAEDARFYSHSGVDVKRIFGALASDIKTMSLSEGASTITQQLVKLTHLTSEKKFSRKANEAYLALRLEQKMDKDEILCAYLNTVYFGEGAYGIESAARAYYGKSAGALTLAEAALLAGIIKAPSSYSPLRRPEKALARREYVLSRMEELGYISGEEARAASSQSVSVLESGEKSAGSGWYRDWVIEEACDRLNARADDILTGGYTIYTCLDADMQAKIEEIYTNGANFPDPAPDGTPAQAAFCAIDSETGAIRALMGGRTYDVARGLNRATRARRQPGSAFKPISVYAAAVDAMGLSPASILDDAQRTFDGGYSPSNAGGKFYGLVTLRTALSKSLNAASVSLIEFTGIKTAREYAMRAGIPLEDSDNGLSLALGSLTYGVTPLELACAYAPLSNGGFFAQGHAIEKIVDRDGRTVYAFTKPARRVMKEESAYLLTSMLETAAQSGSAKALAGAGIPIAGKTGTVSLPSGGNRDIWTVAYTPSLVACAWMGFDETDETHQIASWAGGSSYPAKLLAAFFQNAGEKQAFPIPAGIARVKLDKLALENEHVSLLAPEGAPEALTVSEVFPAQKAPAYYSGAFSAPETPAAPQAQPSGEGARIWFTIENANADFLLVRRTEAGREIIAVASGRAGEPFECFDTFEGESCAYALVARNRRMYENGVTLLSDESEAAIVRKQQTLLDQIERLFAADIE